MGISEGEVIALLQKIFATNDPRVEVGIGDDGAVVKTSDHQVITTDMAVEGVHFKKKWSSAFEIGRKVTAANLADILAMGATPEFLVVSISLTGTEEISWITDLAKGIKHEADLGSAIVVGGDIARGQSVTISITALGECEKPILRSGARIGDSIYLSSLTGWSAAGLNILTSQKLAETDAAKKAVAEFVAPTLDYAMDFSKAHSLCDISDAVLIQGNQLAAASGVALKFDLGKIENAPEFAQLKSVADLLGVDVFDFIFGGGEDHVLLATGKDLPGLCVGEVIQGEGIQGLEMKKAPDTWRHFN